MNANTDATLNFVKTNNLIGIKAGNERATFLEIWMVVVHNRIFARSWGLAEKSWYTIFLANPFGQLKAGVNIYTIKACVPKDIQQLTNDINQAFLKKYNTGRNTRYAKGIIQQKHIDRTMEFVIV